MAAVAPAALALSVTFDAFATLGLVLMSYEGPFHKVNVRTKEHLPNACQHLDTLRVTQALVAGAAIASAASCFS
jgi:hypothetical protein